MKQPNFIVILGAQGFPDNQIAEAFVGTLTENEKAKKEKKATECDKHRQPHLLYCEEPNCKVSICALCIPESHQGHTVVVKL